MHEIDLHTHRSKSKSFIQILNTFAQDLPFTDVKCLYSTGIHPWHLDIVNLEECLHSIETASVQKNMIAIGECGLDRSTTINFATQERYFIKQIKIAEEYHKPLIIHSVQSFPDLIKIKKESRSSIPWIIHGFQGNQQTTTQLIRHDFYFSVGEPLLTNQTKREILSILPSDRLFFETDDRETSINDVYLLAAQLLKTDTEALSVNIFENFIRVFGAENAVNNNLT
jgi:TatD DNase family protein